jgi:hypothetical protein
MPTSVCSPKLILRKSFIPESTVLRLPCQSQVRKSTTKPTQRDAFCPARRALQFLCETDTVPTCLPTVNPLLFPLSRRHRIIAVSRQTSTLSEATVAGFAECAPACAHTPCGEQCHTTLHCNLSASKYRIALLLDKSAGLSMYSLVPFESNRETWVQISHLFVDDA